MERLPLINQWRYNTRIPEVVLSLALALWQVRADLTDQTTLYDVIPPGAGSPYGAGHVVQYLLSEFKMEFNSARAVCRKLGGDIAKVDTAEKYTWIASLDGDNDPSTDPIFSTDHMWSGLTEAIEGEPMWVADCTNGTSNLTLKGGWKSDHLCYIIESGAWSYDRKKCTENRLVLCELPVAITMANLSITWTFNDTDIPEDSCDPYAATTSTSTTTTTTSTTTTTPTTTSTTTTTPTTTSTTTTTPTTTSTTTTTPTTTTPTTTSTTSTTTTTPTTMSTTTTTPTTTSATVTTTAVNCCSCGSTIQNYTEAELESIVHGITKNLTVDAKDTSSHRRSLTCAEDNRPSAVAVGTLGVILIAALFAFIVITDLTKIYRDCKRFHFRRDQSDEKTA